MQLPDFFSREHTWFRTLVCIGFCLNLSACMTWYEKRELYQDAVIRQNWSEADKYLSKEGKKKGRNYLLYLLERGYVLQQSGDYAGSNTMFLEADRMMEDFQKQTSSEILSLVSNPMMKPYQAEDIEVILVHYYLAMNFLQSGNPEAALVECRRMDLRLQALNDKYGKKNRYTCDAFARLLSGVIYESMGDINNAFIAYRNSYECYRDVYLTQLGTEIPLQLKQDLIRTAALNGFYAEVEQYEKEFQLKYTPDTSLRTGAVIFLNRGLGPVKAENSLNFFMVQGSGGVVNFVNDDYGISLPFYLPASDQEKSALGRVQSVRVAFPKYQERKPGYTSATVRSGAEVWNPQLVENVNALAFKTLEDRMLRELGNSLMRLAVKKGIEYAIREQDQALGAIAGLAGAVSEKADTRHWQTLPYDIQYVRIPLAPGVQELRVDWRTEGGRVHTDTLSFTLRPGETRFLQTKAY